MEQSRMKKAGASEREQRVSEGGGTTRARDASATVSKEHTGEGGTTRARRGREWCEGLTQGRMAGGDRQSDGATQQRAAAKQRPGKARADVARAGGTGQKWPGAGKRKTASMEGHAAKGTHAHAHLRHDA